MKRVLLKLSGEALAGEKRQDLTRRRLSASPRQIKQIVEDGLEVGIVIGGGNYWRAAPARPSTAIRRIRSGCWLPL